MITDIRRRAALCIFIVIVLGMQFIRPDLGRLPVDPGQSLTAQLSPPPAVRAILTAACNDCHGQAESWPWYAHVAPASWLVGSDVAEAREHLDLSEWGSLEPRRQAALLDRMCEEARRGEMPLARYRWLHAAARLTPAQVAALCEWAEGEAARLQKSGR
jgi:hypothetical protein